LNESKNLQKRVDLGTHI